MNKLIFRKLSTDILLFFIIASISTTLIIWVIQAVNLLDIVSEDGHSLKVYFGYSSLIVPKIFTRIMTFVYFLSIFYVVSKYDDNNEILVFWSNGIKKINFINFIFKISILFLIIKLILNLLIVPYSQNLGRAYLKNSNVDFLPRLISEKKFITVFKDLTIFIEEYYGNGNFEKIFIKEKINKNKSTIITANKGKIIKADDKFFLRLYNGGTINLEKEKIYNFNFAESNYDLSKFSSNTIRSKKIQEMNSLTLIKCLEKFYLTKKLNARDCEIEPGDKRPIELITEEMYKRFVTPIYIILIGLVGSCLIIKPKSLSLKYYKIFIFLFGILMIILSQISFKLIGISKTFDLLSVIFPIILIVFFYFILSVKTKFQLNKL